MSKVGGLMLPSLAVCCVAHRPPDIEHCSLCLRGSQGPPLLLQFSTVGVSPSQAFHLALNVGVFCFLYNPNFSMAGFYLSVSMPFMPPTPPCRPHTNLLSFLTLETPSMWRHTGNSSISNLPSFCVQCVRTHVLDTK